MKKILGESSKKLNDFIRRNHKKYSRKELLKKIHEEGWDLGKDGLTTREARMGLSREGQGGAKPQPIEEKIQQRAQVRRIREEGNAYKKLYERSERENEELKKDLDLAQLLANYTAERITIRPTGTGTSEAVAVVLASDWHVEEEVKLEQVNHKNRYNLSIAKERAIHFFERAVRLVKKEQQDVAISKMVMWLGGDFITGNIHDELMESCLLRPADAVLYAYDLLASGIQYMLDNSKLEFVFVCSVGNHSRMTKKVHVSTERGNSTEWMLYAFLAKHFSNNQRVQFVIEDSYHTYLDVYKYKIRFHHGHAIRYQGGLGGLHIPLNRAIAQWDKTIKADVDCMGHWHQYTPSRRYIVNGSLIGMNAFGIWIKGEYEPPMQAMFLLDRDRGVTVQMPILV